jgi:sulfite exporter TauE/SafE
MCGPLAMLIRPGRLLAGRIMYNIGRVLTYMVLGAVVGLFGSILHFGMTQQVLTISVGLILLLLVAVPQLQSILISSIDRTTSWIKFKLGFTPKSNGLVASFSAGLFNGFLPCGMVYGALLIALVQPSVTESVLAMGLFGLATIPMLLTVAYAGTVVSWRFPFSVSRLQTIVLVVLALLMIWRGIFVDVGNGLFAGLSSSSPVCVD